MIQSSFIEVSKSSAQNPSEFKLVIMQNYIIKINISGSVEQITTSLTHKVKFDKATNFSLFFILSM